MGEQCFLHDGRLATRALNVPCSPTGKLWVCDECYDEPQPGPLRSQLFDKYFASHSQAVIEKRSEEEIHKGRFN